MGALYDHPASSGAGFHRIETFADLVEQEKLIAEYPWITSKLLGHWRREGVIRVFQPNAKTRVYSRREILSAIDKEMSCDDPNPHSSTEINGLDKSPAAPAGTDTGTMSESERLHAEASERRLLNKPRKNSSRC